MAILLFAAMACGRICAAEPAEQPGAAGVPEHGGRAGVADRLSLNFQSIEVRSALRILADFKGLNLVASDSVAGTLTLRLADVPWEQALEVILQSKGLGMRRSGNILVVAPRSELLGREQAEHDARRRLADAQPLKTQLFQLNYSRAEEVARGLLGATIGGGAGSPPPAAASTSAGSPRILSSRGSVVAVARTNQLLVTDLPAKLEQVQAMILAIDVPVRQVMIEARIVEASETFGRTLGARLGFNDLRFLQGNSSIRPAADTGWSVGGNYLAVGSQTLQPGAPSPGAGQGGLGSQTYTNTQFVSLPASPLQGVDPATFALSVFGASAHRFVNLEISALQADGRGKVVASPRIVTADQIEAHIKQGFRIPYRGSASGPGHAGSIQFQEASLKLTVTPQITPEGQINLSVLVNRDSLGTITPDGREINTKEVKTQVLVEDGGTVVIGGIYELEESDSSFRVPLLSDLPFVGGLFRRAAKERRRTELLVFLTPKILAHAETQAR